MAVDEVLRARLRDIEQAQPRTPTLNLPDPTVDLWCKLEHCNITGSAKDRSAFWMLRCAVASGSLRLGTTVVESSSGNFALAMATYCRMVGLEFVPVIDPKVNPATEAQLRLLCDRVEKVAREDTPGGFLHARLARVHELLDTLAPAWWPNQYGNADAARAHYELTGAELCDDVPRLDFVFIAVSTGGTIAGVSRRVRERHPGARVVAVDSAGSVIFGGREKRRFIPGIGASMRTQLVAGASVDDVVIVEEARAVHACRELLTRHGIFAGGSTGSVYAAVQDYFRDWRTRRPVVAFISPDRGLPYLQTVYDASWVAHNLGGGDAAETAEPLLPQGTDTRTEQPRGTR